MLELNVHCIFSSHISMYTSYYIALVLQEFFRQRATSLLVTSNIPRHPLQIKCVIIIIFIIIIFIIIIIIIIIIITAILVESKSCVDSILAEPEEGC